MKSEKSDKRRLFMNTTMISVATVVEKLVFFAINVIIARYLAKELFGEYVTALGYATFFSIFTNLGIGFSIIRSINVDRGFENEHYTNTILIKIVLSFLVYTIMCGTLSFTGYNKNTVYLTYILGLVRIGSDFIFAYYSLFEAKEKFKYTTFYTICNSIAFLAGTIAVVLMGGNYFHFAYVRLLTVIIIILLLIYHIIKIYSIKFNFEKLIEFIKESVPYSISFLFGNVFNQCGLFILPLIHGTVYAGIYNNANIFFISILFIPMNLVKVLMPYLYKHDLDRDREKFQFSFDIYSKVFAIIAFYFMIIFFVFAGDIILLVFGKNYSDSIEVLRVFSFVVPFIFSIAYPIIAAMDRQRINTRIDLMAVIINVAANYYLILHYDAKGAAAAVVITFTFIFILTNGYLVFILKIKFLRTFINIVKLAAISCALYFFHSILLFDIHFIISAFILSILYAALVFASMIRQNDVRIIKEIISG